MKKHRNIPSDGYWVQQPVLGQAETRSCKFLFVSHVATGTQATGPSSADFTVVTAERCIRSRAVGTSSGIRITYPYRRHWPYLRHYNIGIPFITLILPNSLKWLTFIFYHLLQSTS